MNNRRLKSLFLCVAATGMFLAVSTNALASAFTSEIPLPDRPLGNPRETPLSGNVGASQLTVNIGDGVTLPNPPEFYGITGIGIREHEDRPCEVRLIGGILDSRFGPDDRILGKGHLERCGLGAGMIDDKSVQFGAPNHFLKGVQACTAGKWQPLPIGTNFKLKGLRIVSAGLNDRGEFTGQTHRNKFERAHCRDWSSDEVSCPENTIATAVIMEVRGDSFVGLRLHCRQLGYRQDTRFVSDSTGF